MKRLPRGIRQKMAEMDQALKTLTPIMGDGVVREQGTVSKRALGLAVEPMIPLIPRRSGGEASMLSGLLAWYLFHYDDYLYDTKVYDSSTNSHDGTYVGAVNTTSVAHFDGSNDYINCGTDFIGTGSIGFSAWIRPLALATTHTVICNGKFWVYIDNVAAAGRICFSSDGATTNASSANNSVTSHEWQHVCVTRDAAGLASIYINGALSGAADQSSGTPADGHLNVAIGARRVSAALILNPFYGKIADTRIYGRELTADEIRQIYRESYYRRRIHTNMIFGAGRVFKVYGNGIGDGTYYCYEQLLDEDQWVDSGGTNKFVNRNTTSVTVLNLAEFDPEEDLVRHLAANDLLLAFPVWDDEGDLRWIGVPFRRGAHGAGVRLAAVKDAPGASTTVDCYLDRDDWPLIATEITVTCSICGGSALNNATPILASGDIIQVVKIGATWHCTTVFQDITALGTALGV
jgi:hypothetical protein